MNGAWAALAALLACTLCDAPAASPPAAHAARVALTAEQRAALREMIRQDGREIAALRATQRLAGSSDAAAAAASASAALRRDAADAGARAAATAARAGAPVAPSAPAPSLPDGAAIRTNVASASLRGASALAGDARADLAAYRSELANETRRSIAAFDAAMQRRASRAVAERATQLRERESAAAYRRAKNEGARRMLLRLKLADLHLDAAARAPLRAQLDAMNRSDEALAAAMRTADAGVLAAYRKRVVAEAAAEASTAAARLRRSQAADLAVREQAFQAQMRAAAPEATAPHRAAPLPNPNDVFEGAEAMVRGYDAATAAAGIASAFATAGNDLAGRFATLAAEDRASRASTQAQIAALEAGRRRLESLLGAQLHR